MNHRVCFWYDGRYRNDGPPLFLRQAALRNIADLGLIAADHKIPISDYRRWGKYDLNIWTDFGEDGLPEEYVKIPGEEGTRVYWCSDSHLGLDYRLQKAREADYVFVTIPRHIPQFKEAVEHDRVYHLPHAGEPSCYLKYNTIKRYDVCFIGHLPNEKRVDLLDKLFASVGDIYYGQKFFEEASFKYSESKIVFNHCIGDEANMRVFEATLSGSMLLTSYSEEVEALGYKDGKHLVFYHGPEHMVERTKYYLEHENEREKIAETGRKFTLDNHTYLHRIKEILRVVREEKNGKRTSVDKENNEFRHSNHSLKAGNTVGI